MLERYSTTHLPKDLFLNNEFVKPHSTEKLSVYNPADGSLVADDIPNADQHDVNLAVDYAESAFKQWRRVAPSLRRDIMLKWADLIEEHEVELSELSRITLGSTIGFGKDETSMATEGLRYYAGWVDKFAGESFPQDDGFLKIVRNEPLGVTAGIVPWNGPLVTIGLKTAPALATGNCYILKPSEKTPFAAIAVGELAVRAGLPPGVFQVLTGDGSTGALLARHMKIRKISFTGSIATGKKIQEMAAQSNLKRVTLELGGKSPAVVFDDCDVDNAVKWTVNGITANSGQVCVAASRVYVQEGIYDKFVEKYKQALSDKATVVGDPSSEKTEMGPLVDKAQYDRVKGFINRAQEQEQGRMLTGGAVKESKGYYIRPTAFENVDVKSEIHTQEIFGPVSVVSRFKTEEEALRVSNQTEFGLMAGVFTQDINRALRIAAEFESGMVGINCISLTFMNSAFGGVKQSGLGREGGIYALKAFTEPKTVMVNLTY